MHKTTRTSLIWQVICTLCTTVFCGLALAAPVKPTTPDAWREVTRNDLASIKAQLGSQTPIPHTLAAAALNEWLNKGYDEALSRAARVQSEADWLTTLGFYVSGFRDPHIYLSFNGELPTARWPGFLVAASGEKGVVVERDAGANAPDSLPNTGDVITRCDGKTLRELTSAFVFPYVMNEKLPADQRKAISRLFIYRDNSFFKPPTNCERTSAMGEPLSALTLNWVSIPTEKMAAAAWWRRYNAVVAGPTPEFGVTDLAEGIAWISIPTFSSGPTTTPKLEALVEEIKKRGDSLRNGRAIVLDTRGNGGGNSMWATRVAEAVFGREVLQRHAMPYSGETGIDWRASAENIAFWREWADKMIPEIGRFSLKRLGTLALVSSMQSALDDGKPLHREGSRQVSVGGGITSKRPKANEKSPFPARVYFLSNGSCGSACLDFADKVLFVPGVTLVGAPTSGDGVLMDIRFSPLPSGLADVTIPMKIALGRGRGNLEVYDVDRRYESSWEDAPVRTWVRAQIERETSPANR